MPWEKSFNEADVLDSAMGVFSKKGYDSTSLTDLIQATGINKGSLYNAFKGKKDLFTQSLLRYDAKFRGEYIAELEAMDDPKVAIVRFFDDLVTTTIEDPEKRGCFIVNTAGDIGGHSDEVKRIVVSSMDYVEAFFRRCIEIGQTRGDIPTSIDAQTTAKTLFGLMVAIRLLGRGVFDRSQLEIIAQEAVRLIE